MKNSLWISLVCLLMGSSLMAQEQVYKYKVDVNSVENDELTVELKVPQLNQKELTFHLPKMIPGTYAIYDFGRFVQNFRAYDASGNEMDVEHPDANSWVIADAKTLDRIVYRVEDTWDTDKGNVIFEPAGTNISEDVFVFNNHGIFGYFNKYAQLPFEIEVDRPKEFFGGTTLDRTGGDEDTDIFTAPSYNFLVDNPILFAKPDTVNFKVGRADVLIQVYSPSQKVSAKALVGDIQPILEAQRQYLGGKLPVDKYAFLIYLNAESDLYLSGSAGALEHSYSSFYCLFEGDPKAIAQTVRDVAAHEFFHIVTPLSIHSEEIHYFDFINPKMSQHLWMYEGGTEYAAQHVQVKQGLMPVEQFLGVIGSKMTQSAMLKDDLSFTEMSKTCLDENKDQYMNVYLKGALINMCLDLKLRILTDGAYGIQDLMQDLSKQYGIEKPFKDKKLFKDIVKITKQKELKKFFKSYVAGAEKLPIKELVKEAGITYKKKGMVKELSPFGFDVNAGISFHPGKQLLKVLPGGIDDFGRKELGLEGNDLLYKWNGQELTLQSVTGILTSYASAAGEGTELTITVLRKLDGKFVEKELSATLKKIPMEVPNAFSLDKDASAQQLKIRKAWLGDYITEE
ncbi:MAG: peptidase M61 [Aureispira sp.]|nr:peptidase M61 [Aureispira sp.]